MHNPFHRFMVTMMFIAICLIILGDFVLAEEKSKSQWLNENPCMIKTITTTVEQDGVTTVTKEEVLKCKDGYDGPNYWELFAQYYYSGLTTPAYCRQYARPDHPFKTPGMVCLNEKGVWEEKK
jgi:hypothetical protein